MVKSPLQVLVVALSGVAFATWTPTKGPAKTCKLIDVLMPGRISYPDTPKYNSALSTYYSSQERELNPGCIFRPTNTLDVSLFVKLVTAQKDIQFAVRGGGHTLFTGAANIDGGITVDMRGMNDVTLSRDKKIAQLGGGGIFSDVYPQLVAHNLTVMGARVPGIGVGGFLTGGGITFLSRKYGFACDNVYGYEVVLASGQVIYVTEKTYPDLWLALKGGSNNFGIVTRFDVATFPQKKMWYSLLQYNYTDSVLEAQAKAFSNYMQHKNFDRDAMMGLILSYTSNGLSIAAPMWYTKEVAKPPVYDAFTKIPNLGGVAELITVDDVVETFGEVIPSIENRVFQLTFSFQNPHSSVYMEFFKIWEDGIKAIKDVNGIFIEFLIQPQPVTNGKNLFNLKAGETEYVNIDMTTAYNNASDDKLIEDTMTDIVEKQRTFLKSHGHLIDFVYLNYADISQEVYKSWGKKSVAQLKAASKRYDPKGIFQTRVPGGHKIGKN